MFLDKAVEGSKLTLPYLIRQDTGPETMMPIKTPWQSVGAKAVVTLASADACTAPTTNYILQVTSQR